MSSEDEEFYFFGFGHPNPLPGWGAVLTEVGGSVCFPVLKLAEGAEVVVEADGASDFEREMRCRDEKDLGVRFDDSHLGVSYKGDIGAVVHTPNPFGANFSDENL